MDGRKLSWTVVDMNAPEGNTVYFLRTFLYFFKKNEKKNGLNKKKKVKK